MFLQPAGRWLGDARGAGGSEGAIGAAGHMRGFRSGGTATRRGGLPEWPVMRPVARAGAGAHDLRRFDLARGVS